jgi:hypothetical protein
MQNAAAKSNGGGDANYGHDWFSRKTGFEDPRPVTIACLSRWRGVARLRRGNCGDPDRLPSNFPQLVTNERVR